MADPAMQQDNVNLLLQTGVSAEIPCRESDVSVVLEPDLPHLADMDWINDHQTGSNRDHQPALDPDRTENTSETEYQRYVQPIVVSPYLYNIPTFNGSGRWLTFMKQFEAIALNLAWSQSEMLTYLLTSLRGEAADFAFELEPAVLSDYERLVSEMDSRFTVHTRREISQHLLYNRHLRRNETPMEYAAVLKNLIHRAYPHGLSAEVRNDILLRQFLDGIDDPEACYQLQYIQRPRNIDEAAEKLQEYYSYRVLIQGNPQTAFIGTMTNGPMRKQSPDQRRVIIRGQFRSAKSGPQDDERETSTSPRLLQGQTGGGQMSVHIPEFEKVRCFSCGLTEHYKRVCSSSPDMM